MPRSSSDHRVGAILLLLLTIASSPAAVVHSARPLEDTISNNNGDLVSSACNHTLYNEVCLSSLRSDPRTHSAGNLEGLAEIALDLSIAHANDTIAYVHELIRENSWKSSRSRSCLGDCLEEYSDAIDDLQESVEALKKKDYETLNSLVTAAMTDSDTCEDGFSETDDDDDDDDDDKLNKEVSPLTSRNQYFSKLCSNALAITILLV